jgi:L,D-peptidoglycan transpeptidase YkuD (ErfK/YbiS/YcfS/YnhG family)
MVREFGSTIGPHGWGKRRQDDGRTPVGVYRIKVTFSTTPGNPGRMPWRRRLPTSTVTDRSGPLYNTWIEEPGRTDGDRPSMRWGLVIDYNHVRLRPGVGPAPVPDAGSGIFYHTSRPRHRWEPSEGCTRVEDPRDMHWLLSWLRPEAHPRVVQNL